MLRTMPPAYATLPIDDTLTRENAQQRGYRWVCDVAYDPTEQVPASLLKDFVGLIKDGYKFGSAYHPLSNQDKGLYEPISETVKF